MTIDEFWKLIDAARGESEDEWQTPELLTGKLAQLPPDEIVSFYQHQADREAESYRWDWWAVGYIINGGCSDDGFDYFRGWALANGRERWEAAMKDPTVMGDWADDEVECEDMLTVAWRAYEQATGEEFPHDRVTHSQPPGPLGEPWEEEELEELYPELSEKFY